MEWLRLSGLSVGSLTTTILLGLIVVYLVSLKLKEKDTWYLIGYMGSLTILIAAYTLRYSIYHPADIWIGHVANLVVFGGAALVQFAYHYQGSPWKLESRIVLAVSLIVSALVWAGDFFSAGLPGIPHIPYLRDLLGFGVGVSVVALAAHLWAAAVLIRKGAAFRRESRSSNSLVAGRAVRMERSARNLAALIGATAAVAATHLLFRSGVISRTTFVTMFDIGSLLVGLLILVVYVNSSNRPVSFLLKLVGVSLATVLVSLGLASTAIAPMLQEVISDSFSAKAERAAAIASGSVSGMSIDEEIGYVVDQSGDVLYATETVSAGVLGTAAYAARTGAGTRSDWGARLTMLEQYDAASPYLMRTAVVAGQVYRVGVSYAAYRLVAHRFWIRLALVVLATSALVLAVYPVFFGKSLLLPIQRLIRAVEKVSSGDFKTRVPVLTEDETGRLSRAYNDMIDSLRQAEGNFRALAENANDGIIIVGPGGIICYANSRASELTGFDDGSLVGLVVGEVIPGADTGTLHMLTDAEIVRSDGVSLPVEISGGDTEWHGEPAEVVILRDLSERRAAEAVVRNQQQQIMQADKLASIGALVAGVAHEIHNPNQVIALRAHVINDGVRSLFDVIADLGGVEEAVRIGGVSYEEFRETALQCIEDIKSSTGRINKIVSDLKGYVRSGPPTEVMHTDVNDAVKSVVSMCSHLIRSATDVFTLNLFDEPLVACIGKTELEQVVLNLVQNACHALADRQSGISVATGRADEQGRVCITVTDEGIGMPDEILAQVFDPFFTTKRESGGTGLGLSVSHRLIRKAGGELHIRSAPGSGTTATIVLNTE